MDDAGAPVNRRWDALGDIRLNAIYTGFSEDLSSGLTLGVKLPTGSISRDADIVDRDTQIGTGSTDLLLGAYHLGSITDDNRWGWFANVLWDQPLLIAAGYRPGAEIDALTGAYYDGWKFGGRCGA